VRTGTANLPLHYGRAPRWLFERMTSLAGEIATAIVEEQGTAELLRRLSDPFWFQSLGCVLGFDWHSSGLTTTACGALKEGLRGRQQELGIFVAGGKGATSRRTPQEIEKAGPSLSVGPEGLIYASRMAAKVDSAALQDGYQIYHHTFVFDCAGMWCVIQQGMNTSTRYARRYHWLGEGVQDFVCEPHAAICCDQEGEVLNMVARESEDARRASALISHERPDVLINELRALQRLELPAHHEVRLAEVHPDRLRGIFLKTYEQQPSGFEALLGMQGVGAKTIRALSLVSELVYGSAPSFQDPVRYSFAHGGKDGHPYPVDRTNYDRTIAMLEQALERARVGDRERLSALRRLASWSEENRPSDLVQSG
jgi:hypothetical protein